ncbi:ABC-2 type transporter [Methanothermus fervidus DSM 2088]|uniref:ABC-2 type transporter n=1 Tax=Methanothermus fervidus (strain ATCC 43054 / DSM 2088 / JCM 10308 / V24 S) TaxID=523846 RepID=E3GY30_METFV|nr:ABC transporter permease [Methanothermus fervidus]ADP77212.1 ABC-2 type transporter [Methanothermus fervidus DSM 2088]
MSVIPLIKKETKDIIFNRLYIFMVLLQIFIIVGAFLLSLAFAATTDPQVIDKIGLKDLLSVGLADSLRGSSLDNYIKSQNLNTIYYKTLEEGRKALGSKIIAFVYEKNGNINVELDYGNVFSPVVSQKINKAIEKYRVDAMLNKYNIKLKSVRLNEHYIDNNSLPFLLQSPTFVKMMYVFIIPLVLFLPYFMALDIITDTIVGEKERKTFEILLMAPLPEYKIILGKITPILLFSTVQACAWMILLQILKLPIYNQFYVITFLFICGMGLIGAGLLISMVVESTKESNTAMTLLLSLITFIFFIPLFTKVPVLSQFSDYIPTIILIKTFSNPTLKEEVIFDSIPTLIFSLLIIIISVEIFKHQKVIRL